MNNVRSQLKSLRQRSELRLKGSRAAKAKPRAGDDTLRLFHELQVHQIELELQNEELNQANLAANVAIEKYTDLYDFAPVGYFLLDAEGQMEELNMAGAVLLGVERSRLMGRRFQLFVSSRTRPVFQQFLDKVFADSGRQYGEIELARESSSSLWAEIAGICQPAVNGTRRLARIVVSDISARKLAEQQHLQIGALATTNRNLQREIIERRAAEAALKASEASFRLLLAESQALEAKVRRLAHKVLRAQEEERRRISRELHDEVSQILLNINVQLTLFAELTASNPRSVKSAMGPMRRSVEKAVDIVHRFARELRPAMLDDLGLIPTLRTHIEELAKRDHRTIRLRADTRVEALDNNKRTVLYRVALEALTNVFKHSKASEVEVSILRGARDVSLEVADNGRSFDTTLIASSGWGNCLGLTGMRERVQMIGGRFSVSSEVGKGTVVRAEIPFQPKPVAVRARRGKPRRK